MINVRHLIRGKNWLRGENGKGTVGCGLGMRSLRTVSDVVVFL